MKMIKQMLIDRSKQDWCTVIAELGKRRHHRVIMPKLLDIPLKLRICLSKFRCSVHNLNVETG